MTAAKERPILFSGPMVRALLDGRKTQTRRVVKTDLSRLPLKCPYGWPGDRLWVRERWGINHYRYCGTIPKVRPVDLADSLLAYYATEDDPEILHEMPWRPSIHMPRWASRILLEVTNVRVERLNAISEADAIAEGITRDGEDQGWDSEAEWVCSTPYGAYRELWESINGPGSWDANPWVWVVEFKRVTGND